MLDGPFAQWWGETLLSLEGPDHLRATAAKVQANNAFSSPVGPAPADVPSAYVLVLGAIYGAILLIAYLPAHVILRPVDDQLTAQLAGISAATRPEDWLAAAQRQRQFSTLLGLDEGVWEQLQRAAGLLAPVLVALVTTLAARCHPVISEMPVTSPVLSHAETLIIGAVVAPLLFAASILLTGARGRQILGGFAGAAAYGLTTFAWDHIAAMAGWWHYPYDPRATDPALGLDLIAGVVAGGAFGLLGWRLTGRFGRRGLVGFLIAWSIWGAVHDLGGSVLFAASNLMIFTPGVAPVIADVLNYATSAAAAQLAMRLVAGPAPTGRFNPTDQPHHR